MVVKIVGVGGGGSNAVDRMIEAGVSGGEFVVMNTDAQALEQSLAQTRVQIGRELTRGLGVGGNPEIGRTAAEESRREIEEHVKGADMVFITAGMGGGTGTGAAPIVAECARKSGALTVAVVTRPFLFEGPRRNRLAIEGIAELRRKVDTSIVVPNDRLVGAAMPRMRLTEAFRMADEVVRQGVQGISDMVLTPGLINIDFADVKAVMKDAGTAIMGIGVGTGDHRAVRAAEAAVTSPLLESSMEGAKGVLLNLSAGGDLTLEELYEAAAVIQRVADQEEAFIITGCVIDPSLGDQVRVTVVATGFPAIETREERTPVLAGRRTGR